MVKQRDQGPWASCWNFEKSNFMGFFFFVFLNMGPYGSENFKKKKKSCSSFNIVQIGFKFFCKLSWIFFLVVLTKLLFRVFLDFKCLIFKEYFFPKISNSPLFHIGKQKNCKRGEIWVSGRSVKLYGVPLTLSCLRSCWDHLVHLPQNGILLENGWL